jgi:hypothetical protein
MAYAVTVGKKPSAATSYLDDPAAVFEVLTALSKCGSTEKRYFSALDLPSQAKAAALQSLNLDHLSHQFNQFNALGSPQPANQVLLFLIVSYCVCESFCKEINVSIYISISIFLRPSQCLLSCAQLRQAILIRAR